MMWVMRENPRNVRAIHVPSFLDDIEEDVEIFIERAVGAWDIKTPGPLVRHRMSPPGKFEILRQVGLSFFHPDWVPNPAKKPDPWDLFPKPLADYYYLDWEGKTSGLYKDWCSVYRKRWPLGPEERLKKLRPPRDERVSL